MQKLFKNILLPVRLTRKTNASVEKAIQFANRLQCNLHLIHIMRDHTFPIMHRGLFLLSGGEATIAHRKYKLKELEQKYHQKLDKGLVLFTAFRKEIPEEAIGAYSSIHEIDLILVADEQKKFSFFSNQLNANRLAGKINCPVLTLKSHRVFNSIKIIVLPVGSSLPINKIRVAAYLAKEFGAGIHLITCEKGRLMYDELAYMQKALQILKNNTDLQVVCKTLSGESLGNIALRYAHSINAGLIVVNPRDDSFLPGLLNRVFSRFVYNESKIPVVTVA
jgi:hypothetical protein